MKKRMLALILVIAILLSACAANKATTTATDNMNTNNTATDTAEPRPIAKLIETATTVATQFTAAQNNAIQTIANNPAAIGATASRPIVTNLKETKLAEMQPAATAIDTDIENKEIEIGDYTLKVKKYNLWDESQHDTRGTLYYRGNFVCDEVQAYAKINDEIFVLRGPCGMGFYEMGYYYECVEVHKGCEMWHVYMPQIEDLTNEEADGFFSEKNEIYEGTTNTWVIQENENKYTILVRSYVDLNDHEYYAISNDIPEEAQNPMAMELHEFTEWTQVKPKTVLEGKTFEMFNIVY